MPISSTEKFLRALKKQITTTKNCVLDHSGRMWSKQQVDQSLLAIKTYQY